MHAKNNYVLVVAGELKTLNELIKSLRKSYGLAQRIGRPVLYQGQVFQTVKI